MGWNMAGRYLVMEEEAEEQDCHQSNHKRIGKTLDHTYRIGKDPLNWLPNAKNTLMPCQCSLPRICCFHTMSRPGLTPGASLTHRKNVHPQHLGMPHLHHRPQAPLDHSPRSSITHGARP